jgi:hypothetical protein
MLMDMDRIEGHLKTAESQAVVGNATAAVEALLFAHSTASGMIFNREKAIQQMKDVYSETRIQGYLTDEDRYFQLEASIGMQEWLKKLTAITLEYAMKNNLEIAPIESVLKNRQYMGEHTGE